MAKNRVIPFGYCMKNGKITVDFKSERFSIVIISKPRILQTVLQALENTLFTVRD